MQEIRVNFFYLFRTWGRSENRLLNTYLYSSHDWFDDFKNPSADGEKKGTRTWGVEIGLEKMDQPDVWFSQFKTHIVVPRPTVSTTNAIVTRHGVRQRAYGRFDNDIYCNYTSIIPFARACPTIRNYLLRTVRQSLATTVRARCVVGRVVIVGN